LIFALISLATGIVFLVYAVRYYVSGVIVLLLSRGNNMFNNSNHNNSNPNNDKRKNEPFVSIHLPMYNEKNVVNRIMKACTSLDYKNYEVVVVDDSNDETTKILNEQWSNHPRVKIIHRDGRQGFKGGALNEALKHMNPRADYVLVFDADFMPSSDIVNRFLWYFENSSDVNRNNRKNNSKDIVFERIEDWYRKLETAAVQGYQWHMLNAGENWLTRGVRVEYSGNYMVERTCQEVLGTMKMIAGSVFMIKANVLRKYRWSTSLTEDWELTLRLYMDG
jgi:cellulose synthase/poly-beta-1,6-N-acetylglucosamine synthase-like glycosyltransferase